MRLNNWMLFISFLSASLSASYYCFRFCCCFCFCLKMFTVFFHARSPSSIHRLLRSSGHIIMSLLTIFVVGLTHTLYVCLCIVYVGPLSLTANLMSHFCMHEFMLRITSKVKTKTMVFEFVWIWAWVWVWVWLCV